jgi:hypothetical protein
MVAAAVGGGPKTLKVSCDESARVVIETAPASTVDKNSKKASDEYEV